MEESPAPIRQTDTGSPAAAVAVAAAVALLRSGREPLLGLALVDKPLWRLVQRPPVQYLLANVGVEIG